mmetsp:Transcript_6592/g.9582  ORF Transcript_6592/g.9582 Transcript_6592/m.9582 type:complete len:249 (-) Transcript_6592:48-794(-)|eukprot:CAMPEP_0117423112 /NCGR_PEP_ID=MMETSP0758-20121206/3813_1 /TAXON_ID=63605 /ORGANISM="Percolomonas cosmopolitus, Strain AE-1 (ATCC 50343)" /LENGTH=248 /DNA_ID=CAMNT_0005206129 /DNA_START=358 /DNA_END=1104 /DNA_ORIENTATION=+
MTEQETTPKKQQQQEEMNMLEIPKGFSFIDPRSPTVGVKRTPVKEVFELNAKLDAINFEMFQEEFKEGEEEAEEEEAEEDSIKILKIMEAEDYYATFSKIKQIKNSPPPQGRKKPKTYRKKHGLDLAPIEQGSPQHQRLKALRPKNNGMHSPSGLYCMSPASKTKFSHYFTTEHVQETKGAKRIASTINKENGHQASPIKIDIESPNGLNVSFNDDTYGTFFSPLHQRRKVRRVRTDMGEETKPARFR